MILVVRFLLSFCERVPLRTFVSEVGQRQKLATVKLLLLRTAVPMHHTHFLRNYADQFL